MEFGIFIQTFVPKFRRDDNPNEEHETIFRDIDLVKAADAAGFKYVWITEHHFLDEYSHMSANETVMGYLAHSTDRIHLGSGIFNPLPQVNHPAKVAEKVAMLDHLSNGRIEFGTGRGAGTHEILGFLPEIRDLTHTREIWEDVIGEFPKMFMQDEYEGYQGRYWSLPPRKILPKPWKKPHPPMWYAAGNTTSWEMAAHKGLGVLGFSVQAIQGTEIVVQAYKNAIGNAEPIGAFVNDNVMVTSTAIVAEDSADADRRFLDSDVMYLQSNVFRYHDTFPHPEGIPYWPDLLPDPTPEMLPLMKDAGIILGDPDEALAQCRRWESTGVDQLVFGSGMATREQDLETIRLIGEHIIPKMDKDPQHRGSRFRDEAAARMQ